MKNIKTFETYFVNDVQPGDYIILYIDSFAYAKISGINDIDFVNTHIGKVKLKNTSGEYIAVEYDESTPDTFEEDNHIIYVNPRYIKHISKNKEELEILLAQNKYNL